jgi:hypothetical protein
VVSAIMVPIDPIALGIWLSGILGTRLRRNSLCAPLGYS